MFKFILFLIIELLCNIVMLFFFAIHQHELVTGLHMYPPFCTPPHLLPPSTPLAYHRALALRSLHHAENSHWLSILHMVICMFQCYSFKSPHPLLSLLCPKV